VFDPLLRIDRITKRWGAATALDAVSLTLGRGRTLGLVGGSGSGKSTLARSIARFERPDSGEIRLDGRLDYGPHEVQLIFQEAAASLNPRFTAEEALEEPLRILKRGASAGRRAKAREFLEAVGLPPDSARKPALAFSGGERQRLAIARALIVEPKLLILDESFSGLDLLLQAQMTALLADLRRRLSLTCILISHDLLLAARVADEIRVMSNGVLLDDPADPRAVELFEASRSLSLKGALA
jgi:ABC-type dipeptide/oligopeptide/nickel transport system ATPase subunit